MEEASSLLEEKKKNNKLYIDPVFDEKHQLQHINDILEKLGRTIKARKQVLFGSMRISSGWTDIDLASQQNDRSVKTLMP